ncbi:hypothetical protein [Nocardia alba]|nr:hypothetical protein [Nocardia alba]
MPTVAALEWVLSNTEISTSIARNERAIWVVARRRDAEIRP